MQSLAALVHGLSVLMHNFTGSPYGSTGTHATSMLVSSFQANRIHMQSEFSVDICIKESSDTVAIGTNLDSKIIPSILFLRIEHFVTKVKPIFIQL